MRGNSVVSHHVVFEDSPDMFLRTCHKEDWGGMFNKTNHKEDSPKALSGALEDSHDMFNKTYHKEECLALKRFGGQPWYAGPAQQ